MTEDARDPEFERLLQFLLEQRGFDFTGNKRTSLQRRITKRMSQVGVKGFSEYQEFLESHPEEFAALFNSILINVTSYFRDLSAWHYLEAEILPKILSSKERYEPIRIWCAGASSGEEAYTAAMLLCEALGPAEYRERAKIYATDVDEEALAEARLGKTKSEQLEEVPEKFREKYFELVGTRSVFRSDLRRSIIFGRHDLVHDAPISRIDLVICRNTLMYFDAETQGKILARLHYALNEKGYLFLGKAEMLLSRDELFVPVDLKQRVFNKVPKVSLRERLIVLSQAGSLTEPTTVSNRQGKVREAVADSLPLAQLVVDSGGFVVSANGRARSQLGLVSADVGRPVQDLEISYRPLELRSRIEQAYRERAPIMARNVEWPAPGGESKYFDIEVIPLLAPDGTLLGASISFVDVTAFNQLSQELERSKHELETASEELQATNEELETTNEELQSTVEELETTNEELQSSNEELETMNEELESTNTELEAINTELQHRSIQLDHVNMFLQQIMANFEFGVAVLDKDLRVQLWNRRAEDLWGVRADEAVGQPMVGLDIGLPMQELARPMREALAAANGREQFTLQATNRRGKTFECRLQFTAMGDPEGAQSLIVLMDPVDPKATA